MNKKDMKKPPLPANNGKMLVRLLKMLFGYYPVLLPVTIVCMLFCSVTAAVPSFFTNNVVQIIERAVTGGLSYADIKGEIVPLMIFLIGMYVLSLVTSIIYTQLMVTITQGFLHNLRRTLFDKMQNLPIKYFDTHKHGDIMSHYTNDIDTLRELVSGSLPTIIRSGTILLTAFFMMCYFSLWLALIVLGGVIVMLFVAKKVGGGSAKYFVKQQRSIGKTEGFIQEMMNGQKVIKVFCHEDKGVEAFDKINGQLFSDSYRAHAYANMLAPIIMNIGNILYVLTAIIGGVFVATKVNNVSISGQQFGVFAEGIAIVVSFLGMTRQFTGNVNNVSQQINTVVMALAGGQRVFSLMDEEPEADDGYVTLVNAVIDEEGNVTESEKHTGQWAWKHPHGDGTLTYTPLAGDVRLFNVDFEYEEGKPVLHDVTVYAEPGQKVAFVGATGAGKTTITNLINRFYDIADGKIRYDGINVNKIKKDDLRRSLGIVLQDTNLFTGSVMENIRYGNLDATDEECVAAAVLAGADDFISRLPEGYDTELVNNGSNLSQGQRQLIAIARAAVADPPVMILDEATSSIDTRTEAIVQRGMDKLMEGRTVFVIAHRLSTVNNSDVIMVLDHGRIIERGTHDDLIAEKGTYYQLYTGAFELE